MNLPVDFRRADKGSAQERSLDLQAPPGAGAATLAAAYTALLLRYSGQEEAALEARRGGAGRQLPLTAAADRPLRELLSFSEGLLAGLPEGLGPLEISCPAARESGQDLRLLVEDGRALLVYDAAAFKPSTAARAAGHLRRLAWCLLSEPDTPLGRAPLLTDEEQSLVAAACDGRPRAAAPELFHRAFEARAAAAPGRVAARHRDASLTYGELNARANALARRLAAAGAGREARIAVFLEPSLHVPVALLAALKAGAAYVPLDPTHPEARLRAVLEELAPTAVVTTEALAGRLEWGCPVLAADAPGTEDQSDLGLAVSPDDAAYVFFTSGTTGKPKGAMASQANLAAYLASIRERYDLCETDVVPAIARFSFSISLFELAAPLSAGGTVVLLDRDVVVDPPRMAAALERVTLFHAGPSLLKSLTAHIKARYKDFSPFAGVRHASSGGDMVPPELLETLKTIFSRAEVFVIYGCSEIACMGCTYPVPRDRTIARTYVGRPFDGVGVRVLDSGLNVVPAGVVGEICFSGAGVVKGYLGRPDLTAEKFVDVQGRRFYRTGDMGRLSEDGWLEILGRSDFQVKVRGIRVELAEIEHHLRRAAGVRDGVVMPMRLGADEKALVAYVVLDGAGSAAAAEAALREHMARHLPEYMQPAAYVALDALPLNHNMKVDRRALPPPDERRGRAGARRVRAPRTGTEKTLAALFERFLGVADVGLDDRFFDLGGHSLLGLELLVAAESELGAALKGLELVRETVEGLAALADRRLGRAHGAADAAPPPPERVFTPVYFGSDGGLYGAFAGPARAERAVLICAPLGHEELRAQFVLRRLAERLAERGVPSLRFDLSGRGDSAGGVEAASLSRWLSDMREAREELVRRTGARRVSAVGARLGAALLAGASLELERAVLWDPVRDCRGHLESLAAAHARYVGGWRRLFRPPPPREGVRELLGLDLLEAEAERLSAFAPDLPARAPTVESAALGADPGWLDVSRVGEIMPDMGLAEALAARLLEGS